MRRYEMITIFDPDLSEEERKPVLDRIHDEVGKQNGFMVEVDEWGNRNLAYEIKKKTRGFYYRFDYCGSGALVDELERFFRIDDRVMKYMTVLIEQHVDIEALKAEMAQAAQPEPAPATAAEPAAEATATEATPTETASETSAPETEASTNESESTEPKEEA